MPVAAVSRGGRLRVNPGSAMIVSATIFRLTATHLRPSCSDITDARPISAPVPAAVGMAICGEWEGDVASRLEIVVGAASPQPKLLRGVDAFLGRPMDDAAVMDIAALAHRQTRPLDSVHGGAAWRRQMASVFAARGLRELRRSS